MPKARRDMDEEPCSDRESCRLTGHDSLQTRVLSRSIAARRHCNVGWTVKEGKETMPLFAAHIQTLRPSVGWQQIRILPSDDLLVLYRSNQVELARGRHSSRKRGHVCPSKDKTPPKRAVLEWRFSGCYEGNRNRAVGAFASAARPLTPWSRWWVRVGVWTLSP
nr:hypothetical protein CFP56_37137 [Quercus suber]